MGIRLLLAVTALCFAHPAAALQKTAARMPEDARPGQWNAATTCTVAYYNNCTGWLWIWWDWEDRSRLGVCYDCCCQNPGGTASLQVHWLYCWQGAPPGYGYTGEMDVWAADGNECPIGCPLATVVYLANSGWTQHTFGIEVPCPFIVTITLGADVPSSVPCYVTDHPAAGPTGPQALGLCYPSTRISHSYYYGTATSPLCPGIHFQDSAGDAELYGWYAGLSCDIAVEDASWGQIKAMYR